MTLDDVTNVTAGAAVVSPWWLPVLHGINEAAAWSLPVLGCAWLIMQMVSWLKKENDK